MTRVYRMLMHVMGMREDPPGAPTMAQMTIISTKPVKRSSGSPSPRARG